jgi:hypothetical protein
MIEIRKEGKVFTLPSVWEEITFKQFIHLINTTQDEYYSDVDAIVKVLTSLSGDKAFEGVLNRMYVEEFNLVREHFSWLFEEVDPDKYKGRENLFIIDGQRFALKQDYNKINVGEFSSIQMLLKDKNIDLNPYEVALAVLFRKLDDEGNLMDFNPDDIVKIVNEYSERIYITDVISSLDFFFDGEKSSSKTSADFLKVVETPRMNMSECHPKKSKSTRKSVKKN